MAWLTRRGGETLQGSSLTMGASATETSKPQRVGDAGRAVVVDIDCSGVTVTTGITATLQDSSDGFTTTNDKKSVSITADGTFSITLLAEAAGDQTHLPLRPSLRVKFETGAGDALTVDQLRITQDQ